MSRWRFILGRLRRRLWARAALYSLGAVSGALLAAAISHHLPVGDTSWLGTDAVEDLLKIIASSMLAVTTFSLSSMVAAYAAASSGATPRASTLLIENADSHIALATFIGAFNFSIVGLIALSTGFYGASGRAVLFVMTVGVIVWVVVRLLGWIEALSQLGRVGHTLEMIETETRAALCLYRRVPHLGGVAPSGPFADGSAAVRAPTVGYLRHVDIGHLQATAEAAGLRLRLAVPVGAFVDRRTVLLQVDGRCDDATGRRLQDAFSLGSSRTFEADPRFGFEVLGEIAIRALSPAVNDPGTARAVLGVMVRLLSEHVLPSTAESVETERCDRVQVAPLDLPALLAESIAPIARDGAGMAEIGCAVQSSCDALSALGDPRLREAAAVLARQSLRRAEQGLGFDEDRARVRGAAAWLGTAGPGPV